MIKIENLEKATKYHLWLNERTWAIIQNITCDQNKSYKISLVIKWENLEKTWAIIQNITCDQNREPEKATKYHFWLNSIVENLKKAWSITQNIMQSLVIKRENLKKALSGT